MENKFKLYQPSILRPTIPVHLFSHYRSIMLGLILALCFNSRSANDWGGRLNIGTVICAPYPFPSRTIPEVDYNHIILTSAKMNKTPCVASFSPFVLLFYGRTAINPLRANTAV